MGNKPASITREAILHAALVCFADRGYAATSVQQIVDAARVSKPALYYYFSDKSELFQALVDRAHDERYDLMVQAAQGASTLAGKLEAVLSAAFEFAVNNRELMRLAFATAFASPGEVPKQQNCRCKGERNYRLLRQLLEAARAAGELGDKYPLEDMAMSFYGQLNTYVMVGLMVPDVRLDRASARRIVALFLEGAGASRTSRGRAFDRFRP